MQPFIVETPRNTDEVVALLARHGSAAKLCAGGTDVIPNIKHGLHEPAVLVHLGRVDALRGIHETSDAIVIGAMTTLEAVEQSTLVEAIAPGLAEAARHVAGPHHRRMGTLGGNLCLDTRCLYYNQTYFWREALGFCLKKDGSRCHVVEGGKKCVAAASNDTATMLLCLDATVTLTSPNGSRTLPLDEFYVADGTKNTVLASDELLTEIHIPKGGRRGEGFAKLRHRESIDYPLLSIGVRVDLDDNARITVAKITVNALAARPRTILADFVVGQSLDDTAIAALAARAEKQSHPLTNIADDPGWRKEMVPVLVRRAAEKARQQLQATST